MYYKAFYSHHISRIHAYRACKQQAWQMKNLFVLLSYNSDLYQSLILLNEAKTLF